jgi:hypothetical protein
VIYHKVPTIHPSTNIDIENIDINKPLVSNESGDMVYWYSTTVRNHGHKLTIIETSNFMSLDIAPEPNILKDFWKAMAIPEWNNAIDTELTKFETNNCFQFAPDTGQHLVPMTWLFNIKTDGTKKARLVGRGDMMIPLVDFTLTQYTAATLQLVQSRLL